MQIKGIGATPLCATSSVDYAYSNGEISIEEGVHELIWSEVINALLPYGAIASIAVIATGLHCVNQNGELDHSRERGLLIREPSVRPAHFMRSIYDQIGPLEGYVSDAQRVSNAIHKIDRIFPQRYGAHVAIEGSNCATGEGGFTEFVNRTARQYATARALRLMHGSITASNISLNGAWLDFESTHRPPVYGSNRDYYPGFWNDHSQINKVIDRLHFYINKYSSKRLNNSIEYYLHLFDDEYQAVMYKSFTLASGFPSQIIDDVNFVDPSTVLHFGRLAAKVAKYGREIAMHDEQDLPFAGRHDFALVMKCLIKYGISEYSLTRHEAALIDASCCGEMREAYRCLVDQCKRKVEALGFRQSVLSKVMMLDLIMKQKRMTILESGQLMNAIKKEGSLMTVPLARERNYEAARIQALEAARQLRGCEIQGGGVVIQKTESMSLVFNLHDEILLERDMNSLSIIKVSKDVVGSMSSDFIQYFPISLPEFIEYVAN